MVLSDEAIKFKDKIKKLEETNESRNDGAKSACYAGIGEGTLENKKDALTMKSLELSEAPTAHMKEAKLSNEEVKVQGENAGQETEDWTKAHAEVSEQSRSPEKSRQDAEGARGRRVTADCVTLGIA